MNMRSRYLLTLTLLATSATAAPTSAPPPTVTLTRLDCGVEPVRPRSFFSDTFTFDDEPIALVDSCYLVRHGDDYLLWEAGAPNPPVRPLPPMLEQLGLSADRIKFLGISHFHTDHFAQAASFPKATLLIGKEDWQVLGAPRPPLDRPNDQQGFDRWREPFQPWISGGSKVKELSSDEDVFGDGTVVILTMPGHTPGHCALLVRLRRMGNVLLTGDLTHFRENYEDNGVLPMWGVDRADSLASLDRFKRIAKNLRATVVIQHDPRDVAKLPPFPKAAE